MNDFKSKLADFLSIEVGKVFKAKLPTGSDKSHFVIIVFVAKNGTYCSYFYLPSKVENAKRIAKNDPESILTLTPTDWSLLSKESCIQCNKNIDIKYLKLN